MKLFIVPDQIPDEKGNQGDGKTDDAEGILPGPGGKMGQTHGKRLGVKNSIVGDIDPAGKTVDEKGKGQGFDDFHID